MAYNNIPEEFSDLIRDAMFGFDVDDIEDKYCSERLSTQYSELS